MGGQIFGQIIELLVKQDDERRRISFLFLKILFTVTITAKLYSCIYGTYDNISITDFKSLVDFFIHGTAIVCFALFYFVWFISFRPTSFIFSFIGMWLSTKIYEILNKIINDNDLQQHVTEISKNKTLQKLAKIYVWIDIIEIENNSVKPGTNFHKLYDYLSDIKNGKKTVNSEEFSDTITLIIQFIVIYNLLDFHFLSYSWWLVILTIIILCLLTVGSLVAHVLATMVDIKHSRLLNLMEKLKPDYKNTTNEQK